MLTLMADSHFRRPLRSHDGPARDAAEASTEPNNNSSSNIESQARGRRRLQVISVLDEGSPSPAATSPRTSLTPREPSLELGSFGEGALRGSRLLTFDGGRHTTSSGVAPEASAKRRASVISDSGLDLSYDASPSRRAELCKKPRKDLPSTSSHASASSPTSGTDHISGVLDYDDASSARSAPPRSTPATSPPSNLPPGSSAAPPMQATDGSAHADCLGGMEPCIAYGTIMAPISTQPGSSRLPGTVYSDRRFRPGEATDEEVQFVLAYCSCGNADIFERTWQTWVRKRDASKLPCVFTRDQFISQACVVNLNRAVEFCCPERPCAVAYGPGSRRTDPMVIE